MAGVSEAVIERHEEFAVFALAGAVILGLLPVGAFLMRKKGVPVRLAAATFVVALVVNGLIAWTANLGGQISHPEIRSDQEVVSVGERNEPSEALGHLDD